MVLSNEGFICEAEHVLLASCWPLPGLLLASCWLLASLFLASCRPSCWLPRQSIPPEHSARASRQSTPPKHPVRASRQRQAAPPRLTSESRAPRHSIPLDLLLASSWLLAGLSSAPPKHPARAGKPYLRLLYEGNLLAALSWPLAGLLLASCWPSASLLLASSWPLAGLLLASCWPLAGFFWPFYEVKAPRQSIPPEHPARA